MTGKIASEAATPAPALRYFDASALVKRYVSELGSESVSSLLQGGLAATSRMSEVEVASALSRRCREGAFPPAERDRALAALRRDVAALFLVEIGPEVVARAVTLLTRHALRAADSLQLASCMELRDRLQTPCLFVCSDDRLLAAARREGLATAP
jgi:predicted nucleic acid-binding protein